MYFRIHCLTKFEDPTLRGTNITPISEMQMTVLLILFIIGN